MNKKYICRVVNFVLLFVTSLLFSEIPLVELRGLSTCMQPGYEHLAPAYGALYWHSPCVRNLYEFADANSATVKLAKNLFHVHIDGSFDVTRSATKIARYFDASDIGNIIGAIHKNRGNLQKIEDAIQAITQAVFNKKKEEIKVILLKDLQVTIDRQMAALRQTEDEVIGLVSEDQQESWRAFFKDLREASPKTTTEINRAISKTFKPRAENLYEAITTDAIKILVSSKVRNLLLSVIRPLFNNRQMLSVEKGMQEPVSDFLLVDAGIKAGKIPSFARVVTAAVYEEQQQLFPPENTVYFLLAWLWKHANNREDVQAYLGGLAQILHIDAAQVYRPLATGSYDYGQYNTLVNQPPEVIATFPLEDFIFARYGFDLYENTLPPVVSMVSGVTYHSPDGTLLSPLGGYPDCGATSLRNFFNALLYDSERREFNVSLLVGLKAVQPLIDFYEKYKTPNKINTKEAHNDWSQVVSGVPEVNYLKKGVCEIGPGTNNMFKIVGALIPGAVSFKELKNKLAEQKITLEYRSDKGRDNIVNIQITKPNQKPFILRWLFDPGHFQLEFPAAGDVPHKEKFSQMLFARILVDRGNQWPLVMLYMAFSGSYESLLQIRSLASYCAYSALFSLPTKTPEDRTAMTAALMLAMRAEEKTDRLQGYQDMVMSIYKSLPRDFRILKDFFSNLSFMPSTIPLLEKLKEQQDNFGEKTYFEAILVKPLPTNAAEVAMVKPFYEWAYQALPANKDKYGLDGILAVLTRPIPTNVAGRDILKPLYDWLYQALLALPTSGSERESVIRAILARPLPVNAVEREVLGRFYEWATQELNAGSLRSKVDMIKAVLAMATPVDENARRVAKPFYDWALKKLLAIKSEYDQVSIARYILKMPVPVDDIAIDLLRPFYGWANGVVDTVKDYRSIEKIIQALVDRPVPAEETGREFLAPFYKRALTNLLPVLNEKQMLDVIAIILARSLPANAAEMEFLRPLYDLAHAALSAIENEYYKACAIRLVLTMPLPSDEGDRGIVKPFYDWAYQALLSIPLDQYVVRSILHTSLSADEAGIEMIRPFYTRINQAFPTLYGFNRGEAAKAIFAKPIPEDGAAKDLLRGVYAMLVDSLSVTTANDPRGSVKRAIVKKLLRIEGTAGADILSPQQWQKVHEAAE